MSDNVTALPGVNPVTHVGQTLVEHARKISEHFGAELTGFIIIGFDNTGCYSIGMRAPESIGPTLLCSMGQVILQRELAAAPEIEHQLNKRGL